MPYALNRQQCAVTLAAFSLACSGSSTAPGTTPPPAPPPPIIITTAAVQGTVQDSLAAKAVAGVTVGLAGQSTTTDFLGSYQFAAIPTGAQTLALSPAGFEPYSRAITVSSAATFNVPLRRLAPFLKDFTGSSTSSTLAATFIDLQGASTIDWNQSAATVVAPGFTNVALLGPATKTPVDALTVKVSFNAGKTGITRVTWNVKDSQQNFRTVVCIIGGSCTEQ
jgi:hypothetical protein